MPFVKLDPAFTYQAPGCTMTIFAVGESIVALAVGMLNENAPFELLDDMWCYMRLDTHGSGLAEGEFCLADMIRMAQAKGYQRGVDIHLAQVRLLLEHVIAQLGAAMHNPPPFGWPITVN